MERCFLGAGQGSGGGHRVPCINQQESQGGDRVGSGTKGRIWAEFPSV